MFTAGFNVLSTSRLVIQTSSIIIIPYPLGFRKYLLILEAVLVNSRTSERTDFVFLPFPDLKEIVTQK